MGKTMILEVLGAPYSVRDQIGALEARAIHLLQQLGTPLLFIDEVCHLLAGSHREQRRALNLLKVLTNELKIVIVAVGTSDAYHALQTDVQVASRYEPLLIPRWTETDAFRAFVVAYGKLLPLRKASPIGEPEMIRDDPRLDHAECRHHGSRHLAPWPCGRDCNPGRQRGH